MSMRPLRPCKKHGCGTLVPGGYCEKHRPQKCDDRSEEAKSWRWMYGTDVWKYELRPEQLLKEPFCRQCAREGKRVYATDVDHIVDHKGNWELFSDPENLESLCHSCHSRKTAKELWQSRAKKKRR